MSIELSLTLDEEIIFTIITGTTASRTMKSRSLTFTLTTPLLTEEKFIGMHNTLLYILIFFRQFVNTLQHILFNLNNTFFIFYAFLPSYFGLFFLER